ncbi:site-specific DNA-methyltransferase [Corynebacterium lizhenjunii]|uniref:Site-specific DNA-methyltransferase n=1 Tax=Corynebacterium lizhenjunii TaxID=2709394 RepID=A0A7T0PBJ7_9CORY|nr:site-specific DNA-methyltransferase [Corynebacterium lizhenjunii]QPK78792.1 site-specific DNA-methyltransferase [Corynebacterium lizhenjunii]
MTKSLLFALPEILAQARQDADRAVELAAERTVELAAERTVERTTNSVAEGDEAEPPRSAHTSIVPGTIFWGDNLTALAQLIAAGQAGTVDCIYIDPPFNSGANYQATVTVRAAGKTVRIARPAYSDTWSDGSAGFMAMLAPRLILMHKLLAPTGTLLLHTDWHVGHYVRVLLDEVFGRNNFINEIIWRYGKMSLTTHRFPQNHDTIFAYGRSANAYFQPQAGADSEYRNRYAGWLRDERLYWADAKDSQDKLIARRARKLERELGRPLIDEDVLFDFRQEFKLQDDVFYDISIIKGNAAEKLGYDTQKPERLLERLLEATCPPGGLVADFFGGSGTTAAVAQRTGRRWITGDSGHSAVALMRQRLGVDATQVVELDTPATLPTGVLHARASVDADGNVQVELQSYVLDPAALGLDATNARRLEKVLATDPLALISSYSVQPVAATQPGSRQVRVSAVDVFGVRSNTLVDVPAKD